jgi:predicted flap endonuclease-1-like 5' DNA nuclease
MLDILNPCNDPNACWQQLLMLAGPLLLGYLWAKGSGNTDDDGLSARLSALDAELSACKSDTIAVETSLKTSIAASKTSVSAGKDVNAAAGATVASVIANTIVSKETSAAVKSKKDDLKVVEGIGPKIEGLFNEAGILTFEQLAGTSADRLKEILVAAGSRYQMHDPTTWPAQSKLAGEGKWEELKKWQDELNKGAVE